MDTQPAWRYRPEVHLLASVLSVGTVLALVDGALRLIHWLASSL